MATYKGVEIDTKPTESMANEAQRGLDWRSEFGRGGTEVGIARARDISNRSDLSVGTIKRMVSFFARHEVDKQAEGFRPGEDGYPSNGRIAWALWGGDAGRSWANRIAKRVDSLDEDERALTGSVKKALEKKVEDHNEKHGESKTKRVTLRMLTAVFNRGVGAYKTNPGSVRPSVNSPEQWAYARVNSFLYAVRNEKFRGGKHDTDLFPAGHPLSSKGRAYYEDESEIQEVTSNFDKLDEHLDDSRASDDVVESNEAREDSDMEDTQERHLLNVTETDDSYVLEFAKEAEMDVQSEEEMSGHLEEERKEAPEVVHRAMAMEMKAVDEEARRVRMAISSEEPVDRSFGKEILDHSDGSIDLDFLNSGRAPLLLDHNPEQVLGVIESVELDGSARRLRATVRFGKNGLAREIFDDVVDGIRANVSIGYSIGKMERKDKDEYRAMSWRPVEASIVSIPADVTVGIGRSASASPTITVTPNDPMEAQKMSEVDIAAVEAEARKAAQRSAAQIVELGARHNQSDLARKAIAEGRSIEEFRGELLETIGSERALESQDVGMSEKEVKRFSVMRAIHALANPTDRRAQEAAAFEFECSEAASQQYGRAAQGILLPTDVLRTWKRDLNSSDEAALFTDDFRSGDFIDVLRNASSVLQAGSRMLNGLSGDVKIPKKTAAASASWIATEGGAASESEMTVGSVSMTPKTLGAYTDVTRQLMIQSSMDVEALIRDDLAQAIALAIDLAGLEGSGSSGQPTGILNTSGVNTVTAFAAANPTFAEVVTLETAVAEDNALSGNLAYILPAAMHGALKTTEKASGTAQFVVEPGGTINGYRAIVSNQGTAGNLYFGNFADLLIGMFGGLDLVVDPYTASTSGTVRVVALQSMDVAVRHAVSFAFGNDGA
jgi:HK97 family phage major capsid protein